MVGCGVVMWLEQPYLSGSVDVLEVLVLLLLMRI